MKVNSVIIIFKRVKREREKKNVVIFDLWNTHTYHQIRENNSGKKQTQVTRKRIDACYTST